MKFSDEKWIAHKCNAPENAPDVVVSNYCGQITGKGFVSPETGKICIDISDTIETEIKGVRSQDWLTEDVESKRTIMVFDEPIEFEKIPDRYTTKNE